jgi:hypothetical protein
MECSCERCGLCFQPGEGKTGGWDGNVRYFGDGDIATPQQNRGSAEALHWYLEQL